MKEFKFVNSPGNWMVDLLELNESPYLEINYTEGYIFIGYNPSNHLLYLQFTTSKSSETMSDILKKLFNYIEDDKIEVSQFSSVVMDEGKEFMGKFEELLQEEKIKIRRVNPNKDDHKQLAPLNGMCKYVRQQVIKKFIKIDEESQKGEKELTIQVSAKQLNNIVKDIMNYHNFERKVKPYNLSPAEITVDMIEQFNEMKREYNNEVERKYENGDYVRIQLKHKQLQKGRHQKFSDGIYQVIGKDLQHYQVIPVNFDLERYINYFGIKKNKDSLVGTPVYFRKSYELKLIEEKEVNEIYYPAEETESKHYLFDEIVSVWPTKTQFKDINKETRYIVRVGKKQFTVMINQIRGEKFELSDAEKKYWFPSIYNNVQLDGFVLRV